MDRTKREKLGPVIYCWGTSAHAPTIPYFRVKFMYPRKHISAVVQMIQCFLLLGLQLQVLPSNARKSIRYCLTERHSRRSARLNTKVYGKISQHILLTSAITQILGNGWRMRTNTPVVDTCIRPAFRPIRRASVDRCEYFARKIWAWGRGYLSEYLSLPLTSLRSSILNNSKYRCS